MWLPTSFGEESAEALIWLSGLALFGEISIWLYSCQSIFGRCEMNVELCLKRRIEGPYLNTVL